MAQVSIPRGPCTKRRNRTRVPWAIDLAIAQEKLIELGEAMNEKYEGFTTNHFVSAITFNMSALVKSRGTNEYNAFVSGKMEAVNASV